MTQALFPFTAESRLCYHWLSPRMDNLCPPCLARAFSSSTTKT